MKTIVALAAGVIFLGGMAAVTSASALPASGSAIDQRSLAASEQLQPVHMRRHRHRHHSHRRYRVSPYGYGYGYGYGYPYAPPVYIPFGFGHHGGHHFGGHHFGGHGGHHGHH